MCPTASVIIPTLGRNESYRECLESIEKQTFRDFEVITVTDEGPLARIRNIGAERATGRYLIFIDDDTVTSSGWLDSIIRTFESSSRIGGVSGPAVIRREYRSNRDIFRYRLAKRIYDLLFMEGRGHLPGHITKAGAWTTGACDEGCSYNGEVDFLEACNMAYRADVFRSLGGFDENFGGVGEYCEPDLSYRVKEAGYKLWFSRDAALEHRPSRAGVYKKRLSDRTRIQNYLRFSRRWIQPCWQHSLYVRFLAAYYRAKEKGWL